MVELGGYNNRELIQLRNDIDDIIGDNGIIAARTLDEEHKISILKEMFNKFSWLELEELKKKIM